MHADFATIFPRKPGFHLDPQSLSSSDFIPKKCKIKRSSTIPISSFRKRSDKRKRGAALAFNSPPLLGGVHVYIYIWKMAYATSESISVATAATKSSGLMREKKLFLWKAAPSFFTPSSRCRKAPNAGKSVHSMRPFHRPKNFFTGFCES